jgi:hypothetical protein
VPTTTDSAHISSADTFSEYFRSLKLLNYVQKRLPRWALADQQIGTMDEDERQMKNRAEGTGLDPHQYAKLLSAYLEAEPPESPGKFNWRNIEEFLTTPSRPNPLRQFISDHVARLYDEIGKLPGGTEKARASVRGVVKSGFGGSHDEVYEAYSLLKDEIPKEEIQAVIASWRDERQRFEKKPQYPSGIIPPKVFWPQSSIHFAQEGVARYRFKCDFEIGAFDTAFAEFEDSLADLISSPIESASIRDRAYDLCVISRSRELVTKIRPSIETALSGLISEQTGPYWGEWSSDEDRISRKVPSVATTSFAALALLKLGLSESATDRGRDAATWLLEKQNGDGSWSLDRERGHLLELEPNVHVTISAMEGIARSGISGASHHIELGRHWLVSKQDKCGLWEDEAFCLPQPTVMIIESLDYLDKLVPRTIDTYLAAAIGYLKRAAALVEEKDTTSRRVAVVTAHLGIESFLYSIIQTKNVTKLFDKGQTIGMRSALSSFQTWMQQKHYISSSEILPFSNELLRLAYLRDEIVHKALSVSFNDAASVVGPASKFVSMQSLKLLGFDCLD